MTSPIIIPSLEAILGADKLTELDYAATGCHVRAEAVPEQMPAVAAAMLEQKFYLASLTALDLVESLELVYHFASFYQLCRLVVHAPLAKGAAAPTISHVYPGADWFEREVFEMFGITFAGHPNLKNLILPEDADFHPLLKDFVASS
ncbi:MAG: NADH-quinone oxidoreductase subunit C [Deltaproteobacteria bacterium]|nr:NADH-quinone oxidoreductase subunit C [Deltaproteobacteria bacterium]